MTTELEELIGFLSAPSPPVKKIAVDIVRDYTGSEDGLESLGKYSNVVLPSLSRLLGEKKVVSEPAAQALVNLSQKPELAGKMVEMYMVRTSMETLYKQDCEITSLLIMLLVNLTQLDAGIDSLLQSADEKMHGLYVMKLVRSFCSSSCEGKVDPFEHVASVLVNISKKEDGRKLLLDQKRCLLKQIVRNDSKSLLRKRGVSGTIRNCCFEAENQLQNLLLISEFLWPALLLPVAGNKNLLEICKAIFPSSQGLRRLQFNRKTKLVRSKENKFQMGIKAQMALRIISVWFAAWVYSEEDTRKMPLELASALSIEREPVTDPEIRVQALEAIYLLILQEAGRRAFWSVNGPRILQVGYADEDDPKAMEAYERAGSLLIQESGIEEEVNRDIFVDILLSYWF
ncbi:hypothetical protein H5410_025614 [Solanum commersonii]|uniref:Protein HGH1 homolog n=1 Tax=Solanum commersonii TaxID=4109 RepID=A0A9J5YUQ1_SOLCO|nr:hypothetical protein H5410_025614 [Solanum commersonii]